MGDLHVHHEAGWVGLVTELGQTLRYLIHELLEPEQIRPKIVPDLCDLVHGRRARVSGNDRPYGEEGKGGAAMLHATQPRDVLRVTPAQRRCCILRSTLAIAVPSYPSRTAIPRSC